MNRPYLQVDRLQRAECALDVGQRFVVTHAVCRVHLRRRQRGANDVNAIERRLSGDAVLLTLKGQRGGADGQGEVLGDLVLIDDFAHAHADLVLTGQLAGSHPDPDLLQALLRGTQ